MVEEYVSCSYDHPNKYNSSVEAFTRQMPLVMIKYLIFCTDDYYPFLPQTSTVKRDEKLACIQKLSVEMKVVR